MGRISSRKKSVWARDYVWEKFRVIKISSGKNFFWEEFRVGGSPCGRIFLWEE